MRNHAADVLISIVITSYNHETYIEACLRDMMAQEYTHLELILLDDGSTDTTYPLATKMKRELEARFARVVMSTGAKRGISRALSEAMRLARGAYVYLPGSDDGAPPQAIARLCDFLAEHPDYALAVGDNKIVDKDGRTLGINADGAVAAPSEADFQTYGAYLQSISHGVDFSSDEFGSYRSLLLGNYIPNGYLIRKEAYDRVGGYNPELPIEDWYLNLQLAKQYRMKYLDEVLYVYRRHTSNTMYNKPLLLSGLAKTFDNERKMVDRDGPPEAKRLFAEMVASRTGRTRLWSCMGVLECEIEKFGMGDYYATRSRIVRFFGKEIYRKTRTFLAYSHDWPKAVDRNVV